MTPSEGRQVRFLVNPAAGRGTARAQFEKLRILASRAGAGFVFSRSAEDLRNQARRAVEDGVERLLVAGGDGTMHHAAQALAGTACALGVLPLGTGNDLAGTLGVPADLDVAVHLAITGAERKIDLIRTGSVVSLSYAGVGFDSETTGYANSLQGMPKLLVYPWAVLRTLAHFTPPRMKVVHDCGTFEGGVMFANACNLPRFGGGMRIAPEAKIDDGLLDLVIVKAIPRLSLVAVFPKVYAGKHVGHPAVELLRTRRAELTIDRDAMMYGGGEPMLPVVAGEPVAVEVFPKGLTVVGAATE